MTMSDVPGGICAPQCNSNGDCEAALNVACSEMTGVRPLCSVVGRSGATYCGLFCCHADHVDGNTCGGGGLAQCHLVGSTQRLMCMFDS